MDVSMENDPKKPTLDANVKLSGNLESPINGIVKTEVL